MWIGTRPWRSGSPKVSIPSPPKVVPSREKSAWFWLMGRSCPLQNAQPLGGKFHEITLISPRNGSLIRRSPRGSCWSSRLRREDAEQRDDEVHRQERQHVVVRLAAT